MENNRYWLVFSLAGWAAFIGWAFLWIFMGNEPRFVSWPLLIGWLLARTRFRSEGFHFPRTLDYWFYAMAAAFFIPSCLLSFFGEDLSLATVRGCETVAIVGAIMQSYFGIQRDHCVILHERTSQTAE